MRFELISGDLALDFIGTVSEWSTRATELLAGPGDLAEWVVRAGLLDRADADDEDLAAARALRAGLYGHVRALTGAREGEAADRAVINHAAAGAQVRIAVDATGGVTRTGTVAAALSDVARAGILLGRPPVRELISWCDDPTCTRAFLDRSRGGRRRWCGMAGCGDKAKAAAYRRRRRSG